MCQGSSPFGLGKERRQVVWGQHEERTLRLDCRLLHGQNKIRARAHIPHIEECGVTSLFQLPGEPHCPGTVGMGIADEKVYHR